jgi:hypothetical protein
MSTFYTTSSVSDGTYFKSFTFSITIPSGATLRPVPNFTPNNESGFFQWYWNSDWTYFVVQWTNNPEYISYVSANDSSQFSLIQGTLTNGTLLASGNITINGVSWPFETFHYYNYNRSVYQTDAIGIYKTEGHFYELTFSNTSNDTLSELEIWSSTFSDF